MIAVPTAGCSSTKAWARWLRVVPASRAMPVSASTRSYFRPTAGSSRSDHGIRAKLRAARVSLPGTSSRRYFPASHPMFSGLHTRTPRP